MMRRTWLIPIGVPTLPRARGARGAPSQRPRLAPRLTASRARARAPQIAAAAPRPALPEGGRAVWALIALCGVCDASYSQLAPFFPQHAAEAAGLSPQSTGLIFSCFQWGGLLWVPAATRISASTSPRLLLSACVLLQAALTALFAPTAALGSARPFFAATFGLRLAQGLVTTTYEVAVTSLLMRSCAPERVGTWVGIQEAARGVGMMAGPALGGWLYGLGGFALPFVASACALLLLAGCVLLSMGPPAPPEQDLEPRAPQRPPVTMLGLLRTPRIAVPAALFCALAAALTILDPVLGPHEAAAFRLGPAAVGLTFSAATLAYAALAPLAGALGARVGNFRTLVVGMGLTAASFLLIGPSPWLPDRWLPARSEGLLVGALAVLGMGASSLTCCLPVMLDVTAAAGYETAQVSDVLGGIISLAWTGGALAGPLFGSAAVAAYGFADATSLTGAALLGLTALGTLLFACGGGARGPAASPASAPGPESGGEPGAGFAYAAFPEPPGARAAVAPAAAARQPRAGARSGCSVPELSEPLLDSVASH